MYSQGMFFALLENRTFLLSFEQTQKQGKDGPESVKHTWSREYLRKPSREKKEEESEAAVKSSDRRHERGVANQLLMTNHRSWRYDWYTQIALD